MKTPEQLAQLREKYKQPIFSWDEVILKLLDQLDALQADVLAEHQAAVDMFIKYEETKDQLAESLKDKDAFYKEIMRGRAELSDVNAKLYYQRERLQQAELARDEAIANEQASSTAYAQVKAELEVAREALQWYADGLYPGDESVVDGVTLLTGRRARTALALLSSADKESR